MKLVERPIRFVINAVKRVLVPVCPKFVAQLSFFRMFHKFIDMKNPKTLNEKIQWLLLNTDISEWTRLSDKYQAKVYLNSLGLSEYVPKLYGVWSSPEEINLDTLPDKFVLKCTHDCGSWKIINKKELTENSWREIKQFYATRIKKVYGTETVELQYKNIPRRVMAEEFIENDHSDVSESIIDYKIWCFDGEPYACLTCIDRANGKGVTLDVYELPSFERREDWLAEDFKDSKIVPKPKHLDKMLEIARFLSKPFPQVRIDLYESGGKVFIGEFTFTSEAGRMAYFSEKAQLEFGSKITLFHHINN